MEWEIGDEERKERRKERRKDDERKMCEKN